ncbi:hypothetical protein D3C84_623930 [compost metagenome]
MAARPATGRTSAPGRRPAGGAGLGAGGGNRARRRPAGRAAGRFRGPRPVRLQPGRVAPGQRRAERGACARQPAGQGRGAGRSGALAGQGPAGGKPRPGPGAPRQPWRRREPDQPRRLLGRPQLPARAPRQRGREWIAGPRPGAGAFARRARGARSRPGVAGGALAATTRRPTPAGRSS